MPTPDEKKMMRSRILRAIFGSVGSAEEKPFPGILPSIATGALGGLKAAEGLNSPGTGLIAGLVSGAMAPMKLQMELEKHRADVDKLGAAKSPHVFQMMDKNKMRHVVTVDPLTGTVLSDVNTNIQGPPSPFEQKGNQESVMAFMSAQQALQLIDPVFDKFESLSGPTAKFAGIKKGPLAPLARMAFPELKALEDNFIANTVFSMGGKQLTITEKETVTDAFLPSAFDNQRSRNLKKKVVRDYLEGKIDVLQAANLLGPAGSKAKAVLEKALNPLEAGIDEREKFIRLLMRNKNFTRTHASQAADMEGL